MRSQKLIQIKLASPMHYLEVLRHYLLGGAGALSLG